ncbi:MAG: hypothetical protein CL608_34015 [Anaerolineaceae bacterium]|nr:hypothetical protein [Anaerolineaceae bacterium]
MYQQTRTVQDQNNQTMNKANHNLAQTFVVILQVIWRILRKIAANVMIGFHIFVEAAAQKGPSHNEYWWDSPDVVDDLMKR